MYFAARQELADRRRAEEALRESEERFRTLFEYAPEAILVVDADTGLFVDPNGNAARLYKLSREELLKVGPGIMSPPVQPDGSVYYSTSRPGHATPPPQPPGQPPTPPPAQAGGTLMIAGDPYRYAPSPAPDLPTPPPASPYPTPGTEPPVADFNGFDPMSQPGLPSPFGQSPAGGADSRTTTATADLASRYLDLQADVEIAETTVEEQKRLAGAGLAPQGDSRRAEIKLRTLKRKLAVVEKLLNGEIVATEAEMAWLAGEQERVAPQERGRIQAQIQRATMRLEAMRSVR
jgi:hypothetical protein